MPSFVTPARAAAAGAALAAAVLAFWVFRPAALRVEVAKVERGALRVTVDEEGETRVRERYVVAAPTTGRLLRISLDEGDHVQAGDLVARILAVPLDPRDSAAAQARLEAAEANQRAADARVGLALATLEQARRSEKRARTLRAAGTVSTEAFEQAQLDMTRAEREHEAARRAAEAASHEVDAARATLIAVTGTTPPAGSGAHRPGDGDQAAQPGEPRAAAGPSGEGDGRCTAGRCVEVRAPVAGEVLRVHEESERIVAAGTPLLDLGDPHALEIVVDVLSTDAVRIEPGDPVRIEDWGGDHPLRATVRRIEPSAFTKVSALGVEEQRVNVIADLLENVPGLGDGYRVEARIVVWEGSDVLRVPTSALFRSGESWAVFVLDGGVARRRAVEIGHRGGDAAEVVGGLAEGDTVILHPSDRLADGVRVAPF